MNSSTTDSPWEPLVGTAGVLTKDGSGVVVSLDGNRAHQVTVVAATGGWEISGPVVDAKALSAAGHSTTDLWRWNAERCLTAYVVEDDGSVWVTALMPSKGLSSEEFGWMLTEVAREADRLEYRCTGLDLH